MSRNFRIHVLGDFRHAMQRAGETSARSSATIAPLPPVAPTPPAAPLPIALTPCSTDDGEALRQHFFARRRAQRARLPG